MCTWHTYSNLIIMLFTQVLKEIMFYLQISGLDSKFVFNQAALLWMSFYQRMPAPASTVSIISL